MLLPIMASLKRPMHLDGGSTHIVVKFPGVHAQPSSISLLSQPSDALSPSSVFSYEVPHVSENARGPTEPTHLSPRHAGDEKQIQERSSVAAFGVTQE